MPHPSRSEGRETTTLTSLLVHLPTCSLVHLFYRRRGIVYVIPIVNWNEFRLVGG